MTKFTHLHVHSHYSLLDGLPKIDELISYAKEMGMDSLAITDHGVLYGAVEFYKKAKAQDLKPIIGCEMYVALETMDQKRPNIDNKNYHLLLLAKNSQGYKNLVKLITKAHLEGFYYKPRIDEKLLKEHSEGLICLSGCLQGKLPRLILAGKIKEAQNLALFYQDIFGRENFYLELQHHPNIKEQKMVNDELAKLGGKFKIPLVATNDSHYLKPEDAKAQDILLLVNTQADPDDPERLTLKGDDFSLKSPQEMILSFKETPQAIENTQRIKELCDFEFKLGDPKLPSFQVPNGKNPDEYLKNLCLEGLQKRGLETTPQIRERLDKELKIISQTGFASYFLIVQDFVNWAKENRIVVGPGRGSVGGSLVSYLLKITDIDPLKYNLLFERFLNPERAAGLPDIDLDFTDRRRDEVIEYVRQKYGQDKVAQIITFGTMASRAAIRDVGRALNLPYEYCDRLAKMIPFGFSLQKALKQVPEFREIYEQDLKAAELIDFSLKLEGVARHASTHACGVVISKDPLQDIVPLQHPTQSDKEIVTQYEMRAIEDLGLLKMDFLGLKNLTIIEDTLAKIYAIHKKSVDISKIPLNDKKTYKLLQDGNTKGIFQLESQGMQRYLKDLKPTQFEDIVAMVALYRPGPMQFIPEYIARKHGRKKVDYLHPKLEPILKDTWGICLYQEQLMRLATDLAGFTLAEADWLRKAVGKKIKSLLMEQRDKMIQGMIKNGIPKKIAQELWEWVLPFARYGFNRAHSVAYGLIAYQTAWLKANYSLEFMSSLLTSESSDIERISELIAECAQMGIEVLAPDINESFRYFSAVPGKDKIRFGLAAIKNVGENVVEAVIAERKKNGAYKSIQDFIERLGSSKVINKKSLESLIKAGVFDKLAERKQLLENTEKLLEWAKETRDYAALGQNSLFAPREAGTKNANPYSLPLAKTEPATEKEKLSWEKELLGLYISSHPLKNFRKILQERTVALSKITRNLKGRKIRVGGLLLRAKRVLTKNGKPMVFAKLEDQTGVIEVIIFPKLLEETAWLLEPEKIVLIAGKVDNRNGDLQIIADSVEEIVQE